MPVLMASPGVRVEPAVMFRISAPALPHRVCPSCGSYDGKQVITVASLIEREAANDA